MRREAKACRTCSLLFPPDRNTRQPVATSPAGKGIRPGWLPLVYRRTGALKTPVIDTGDAQAKEFRDRPYREAATAGALSHPNIVTMYDIIDDGAITAVAMEFIEGRSLAAIIVERGAVSIVGPYTRSPADPGHAADVSAAAPPGPAGARTNPWHGCVMGASCRQRVGLRTRAAGHSVLRHGTRNKGDGP